MVYLTHNDLVRDGYSLLCISSSYHEMKISSPCIKVCKVENTSQTLVTLQKLVTCQSVDSQFSPKATLGTHLHHHINQYYKLKDTSVLFDHTRVEKDNTDKPASIPSGDFFKT